MQKLSIHPQAGILSGLLGLVLIQPLPATADQAETLEKLRAEARERRTEVVADKLGPAARMAPGGPRRAQILAKLNKASLQKAQGLTGRTKAPALSGRGAWLAKLHRLSSQQASPAKLGVWFPAAKASAVQQVDEDAAGRPTLVFGANPTSGQLSPVADVDTYQFEGDVGAVVDIALGSDEFDAYLELEFGGEVVAVDDDGGEGTNSLIDDFTLPTSGTYLVRVHAYSDAGSGAYTLAAAAGGPELADHGTLVPGTDTYELDSGGAVHLFHLEVAEYSQVEVQLSSPDFDTFLSLYQGSGAADRTEANLLAFDDDGGGGTNSLLLRPLETGSYLVEVRAFSAEATGTYTLALERRALAGDEDSAAPVSLALGQPLNGGLFPQGDTDTYTFTAQAGEVIDIGLVSEDFDCYVELVAGEQIIAVDDDGGEGFNALLDDFVIPLAGTYEVVVHAYGDGGEGSYQVGVIPQEVPWTLVGDLEAGRVQGALNEAGDIHFYTFSLAQLSQVTLDLGSADFDSYLTLYVGQGLEDLGPENQLAADDDGGGGLDSRLELALEAGEYLVQVRSFYADAAGDYELNLDLVGLDGDEDQAGAPALSPGRSISGALRPAGDTDVYLVAGLAGEVLDLGLESEDFDAFLELKFSGEVIALDDDSGEGYNALIDDFVLPFTGTYGVLVHSLGDNGTGSYMLSLEDVTPPVSANSAIGVGSQTGQISESGQLQLYPLVLSEPAEVAIDLRSEDFDAFLTLFRGSGPADRSSENLLAEDDDSGEGVNARLALLLAAGQYLIEARPLVSGSTGAYTLEIGIAAVTDDEDQQGPMALVAGSNADGRLSPAGDIDAYSLVGSVGQQLQIGVESTDFDPFVELLRNGAVVAADDDGGEDLNALIADFALPAADTYQIRVRSYADQGVGAYTLRVQSISDQQVMNGAIEPGNHTGQLASAGQLQLYPFRLADRALVQLSLSSTRYAAGLALYQGADLADLLPANLVGVARALAAGETAQFSQELPAGEYLFEVGIAGGAQAGTYGFSLKTTAVQQARDRVSLLAGALNQTRITPFAATLTVAPGAKISGQLEVAVDNTHPRSEIFQLVQVQTWGERPTAFREVEDRVLPGNTRHLVPVELNAPEEPGTYHLILAAAAEPGAAEIASGTHWESAPSPRWGDGDDLAAWSSQRLELAKGQGWVEVEWYQNYDTQIGAFALEVVVAPEQTSSGPVSLDFNSAQGDQAARAVEGASAGQTVQVQLHVADAPRINGWGVQLQYDPDHLSYVGSSFAPGTFIPGLVPLVAETVGQVEVGGAVLGGAASNAGSGHLGTLSFLVQPGFSTSTALTATQVSFRTLDQGRTKASIRALGTVRGGAQAQTGPVSMDFDLASGDQEQRQREGVEAGQVVQLQLNVADAPQMRGWSARLEYDPSQLRFVSGSFAPSLFIPGLVALVGEKEGRVDLGGTILGSGQGSAGDGALGTFSFEVLPAFGASAELVITRISFNTVASGEVAQEIRAVAVFSAHAALAADFDASGAVDFSDFFLFADHFGQSEGDVGWEAQYDLSANGEVDFSDFFLFADNFGREAQGKLLALARQLLGLPEGANLGQNFPNPFNSATQIRYQLDQPAQVAIEVFGLNGQRVRTLVDQVREPGLHQVAWDGLDEGGMPVASGAYFCRLRAGDYTQVRRMLYLR